MSGSAGAAPIRYAGIQVQTSALGVQMPVGWGTFRCKCNLVWYNNFKSKAQQAVAKGGTTTGYNYSASLILGLCEGPIVDIPTIWVDSKAYVSNAAAPGSAGNYLITSGAANRVSKTALAQAGLSMATGAIGQAVWSYLTSNYPAQAIGYSGLCIIYAANYPLDSGAGTPQHSFEVQSNFTLQSSLHLPDANPEGVLTDFFTNARYGLPNWASGLLDGASFGVYSTYCLAANLLVSPVLDQQRQASDFLQEMMTATNSNLLWSEGLLKIVVYGDTAATGNGATYTPNLMPVYALADDHFIPQADGDDALFVDIQDQSDAYNIVQFEYLDRTNAYSTAIATANDTANIEQFGRRKQDPTTVHVLCDPTVAQNAAQLYLQRTLYIRKQFKFTVGWQFALLEPGDIVTLAAGDDVDVASTHSESSSSALTWTFPGTAAAPNRVFSCDTTNSPATGSDLVSGALLTTTTVNGNLTIGGSVYIYGLIVSMGSGTTSSMNLTFGTSADCEQIYEACAFKLARSVAADIVCTNTSGYSVDLKFLNTTVNFSATGQSIQLGTEGRFLWKDTSNALGSGAVPTKLIQGKIVGGAGYGVSSTIVLDGIDLSPMGSGTTIIGNAIGGPAVAQVRNCKLGSGVTVAATPVCPSDVVADLINSDSSATGYRQERYRYQGTLTTETTVVKSGGASDDVTPISWKVVATANARRQSPFEAFEIVQWVDTAGTAHTATIDVITDTHVDATLTNADVWMEAQVMDNAGAPITSLYTSAPANLLTAGTTLATSSASWTTTGMTTPNPQKMSVTFTNQIKGYVRFVVKVGRASLSTIRIDPNVAIV